MLKDDLTMQRLYGGKRMAVEDSSASQEKVFMLHCTWKFWLDKFLLRKKVQMFNGDGN